MIPALVGLTGSTKFNSATPPTLTAIGYDASGAAVNVIRSTNGTSWTSLGSFTTSTNANMVTPMANSGFKIGSTYYWMSSGGGAALLSTTNWSSFSNSASTSAISSNGAAYNGTGLVTGRTTMIVQSSSDLSTWSSSTAIGSGNNFRAAAYGAGTWVVTGSLSAVGAGAWTNATTNGSGSWTAATTQMTSASTSTLAAHVIYAGGKFVAVGGDTANGAATWTSTNGTTWTSNGLISGSAPHTLLSVAYDGTSRYVAVSNNGNIYYSANAASWTQATTPAIGIMTCVAYQNGYWVAVGNANTLVYSTDGATWTSATLPTASSTDYKLIIVG